MTLYNNNKNNVDLKNQSSLSSLDYKPSSHSINSGQTNINSRQNSEENFEMLPTAYKKRWLILSVFCAIYMLNSFHLTQYGDLQYAITSFYNISLPSSNERKFDAANWLSVIHIITNLVFVLPAMFLLDYKGLKMSCMIAICLTTIGSWIKCSSVRSDLYGMLVTGQVFCGIAQAFIQSCLVKLAALWFLKNEVATAIAIGIVGGRIGYILGFVIPPYVILKKDYNEINKENWFLMYLTSSFLCTITLIITIFAIKDKPLIAPSFAQSEIRKLQSQTSNESKFSAKAKQFFKSLVIVFKNKNFMIILFSNAMIVGSYLSLTALLEQNLYEYYPNENFKIGFIILFFIISALFGLVVFGIIIDRTRAYKFSAIFIYSGSLISIVLFWTTTPLDIWYPFFTLIPLGFFLNAFLPVGYEIAVEFTYPISEGISCGLLNLSSIAVGLILMYSQGFIATNYSSFYSNFYLSIFFLTGLLLTILIKKTEFKRQQIYDLKSRGSDIKMNISTNSLNNK